MSRNRSQLSSIGTILLVIIVFGIVGIVPFALGIGGFGPTNVVHEATVTDKKVDVSGNREDGIESHYMVYTDKGVFEVDNGLMLGMWNADEVYAKAIVGKTYTITTKGNRVVNFFFQEYPYITNVQLSN